MYPNHPIPQSMNRSEESVSASLLDTAPSASQNAIKDQHFGLSIHTRLATHLLRARIMLQKTIDALYTADNAVNSPVAQAIDRGAEINEEPIMSFKDRLQDQLERAFDPVSIFYIDPDYFDISGGTPLNIENIDAENPGTTRTQLTLKAWQTYVNVLVNHKAQVRSEIVDVSIYLNQLEELIENVPKEQLCHLNQSSFTPVAGPSSHPQSREPVVATRLRSESGSGSEGYFRLSEGEEEAEAEAVDSSFRSRKKEQSTCCGDVSCYINVYGPTYPYPYRQPYTYWGHHPHHHGGLPLSKSCWNALCHGASEIVQGGADCTVDICHMMGLVIQSCKGLVDSLSVQGGHVFHGCTDGCQVGVSHTLSGIHHLAASGCEGGAGCLEGVAGCLEGVAGCLSQTIGGLASAPACVLHGCLQGCGDCCHCLSSCCKGVSCKFENDGCGQCCGMCIVCVGGTGGEAANATSGSNDSHASRALSSVGSIWDTAKGIFGINDLGHEKVSPWELVNPEYLCKTRPDGSYSPSCVSAPLGACTSFVQLTFALTKCLTNFINLQQICESPYTSDKEKRRAACYFSCCTIVMSLMGFLPQAMISLPLIKLFNGRNATFFLCGIGGLITENINAGTLSKTQGFDIFLSSLIIRKPGLKQYLASLDDEGEREAVFNHLRIWYAIRTYSGRAKQAGHGLARCLAAPLKVVDWAQPDARPFGPAYSARFLSAWCPASTESWVGEYTQIESDFAGMGFQADEWRGFFDKLKEVPVVKSAYTKMKSGGGDLLDYDQSKKDSSCTDAKNTLRCKPNDSSTNEGMSAWVGGHAAAKAVGKRY